MRAAIRLWNEEQGAIISAEIMLVGTLLVIGVIVGIKSVRDAVVTEMADVAQAMNSASQGFWYGGSTSNNGQTYGASYNDQSSGGGDNGSSCINIGSTAFSAG